MRLIVVSVWEYHVLRNEIKNMEDISIEVNEINVMSVERSAKGLC